MANDAVWDGIRGGLIALGSAAAASGYAGISQDQVAPLVDNIMTVGGAAIAVGSFLWLIYTKFRTVAVPVDVVIASQENPRVPTIPTVSPVTGAMKSGGIVS